jgi:hypothetical protein
MLFEPMNHAVASDEPKTFRVDEKNTRGVFIKIEGLELKAHERGATRPKRDKVACPVPYGAPPRAFWPPVVASPPPFAWCFIYLKNLPPWKEETFHETERRRDHDLHFRGQILFIS